MRKLLTIATPLALLASPALAQSVDGRVDITGTVAGRCLFTLPNETINLGELALQGSGATAGRLDTTKVDGQTKTLQGWCNNAAASMSVTATPLANTAPAANGFNNRINYTATAVANSATATDTSFDTSAGTSVPVGMFTGGIVVTLSGSSTPTPTALLVAGAYTGNVVVTLTPTVALP